MDRLPQDRFRYVMWFSSRRWRSADRLVKVVPEWRGWNTGRYTTLGEAVKEQIQMERIRMTQRGITMVEILIGAALAALVGAATLHFYLAQHELYLAQADISDRQGNLRSAVDELSRQVRLAGYRVTGPRLLRTSGAFDTLEVYIGNDTSLIVDTLRYYVNRADNPPSLVRQKNKTTPAVFAQEIDSVHFVPVGAPVQRLAITLVSVVQDQFENSALTTRRRIGETINLRNR
jgi:hypothetical protein